MFVKSASFIIGSIGSPSLQQLNEKVFNDARAYQNKVSL